MPKGKGNKGNQGKGGGKKGGKGQQEEEKKGGGRQGLGTCKEVKASHILCEKHGKIMQAYDQLTEVHGTRPPKSEFATAAGQFSECSSSKKGGDLGWFGRQKMVGPFTEVAFGTEPGTISQVFRTSNGYHIVFVEGRRN